MELKKCMPLSEKLHTLSNCVRISEHIPLALGRAGGTGVARGAIAPAIFLKIREKVASSTPNISRLVLNAPPKIISTPNFVHISPSLLGLYELRTTSVFVSALDCTNTLFLRENSRNSIM